MPALIDLSLVGSVFRVLALTAAAQEEPAPPPPPPPPTTQAPEQPAPPPPAEGEKKEEKKEEKTENKEGEKKENGEAKEGEKREEKEEKGEKKEGEGKEGEEGEEEEGPWAASIDLVIGFDTTDVGVEIATTNGAGSVTGGSALQSSRITTASMIVGLEREVGRWEFGARLPLLYGSIDPRNSIALDNDPRGVATIGNLELEAAYNILKQKGFELQGGLELALPTGGGVEQPSAKEIADDPTKQRDFGALDRGAIMRAVERARGSYESALFEPDRIGFVPRVGALIQAGVVDIRPGAKVEILQDTSGDAEVSTIAEFVGNVRLSVHAGKVVEPGVNVWTNLTLTKHEERHADLMAAYPFVRFKIGALTPEVGAILPFFGVVADEKAFGLRAALSGRF